MTKDARVYLVYIIEKSERLMEFCGRENAHSDFVDDWITQAGILRTLHTIAESTQKLPESIKQDMPEIEWQKISAMRHILVHGYLGDISMDMA